MAVKKPSGRAQKPEPDPGEKTVQYSKQQLIRSEKYHKRRDIMEALLDENRKYTTDEADRMVEEFMKGKVE